MSPECYIQYTPESDAKATRYVHQADRTGRRDVHQSSQGNEMYPRYLTGMCETIGQDERADPRKVLLQIGHSDLRVVAFGEGIGPHEGPIGRAVPAHFSDYNNRE